VTGHEKVGAALRFLASGGMADEDPDVIAELLTIAHRLADQVLADPATSADVRATAREFLDRLSTDTLARH
jgi:hypothetical protein